MTGNSFAATRLTRAAELAHGAEVDLPNVFRITPLLMAAAGMTGSFRSAIDPVGGTTPPPGDLQVHAI